MDTESVLVRTEADMADSPRWATRIRTERKARSWDVHSMARHLRVAAGDDRAGLPDHESLVRSIRRWESQAIAMLSERYRLLYCRAFSVTEGVLFDEPENNREEDGPQRGEGDPTNRRDALKLGLATTIGQVLGGAADEAMEFTRRANTTAVGRSALEHLQTVVRDLAGGYSRCAPVDLFAVARLYRRRIDQFLAGRALSRRDGSYPPWRGGCRSSWPGSRTTWATR